MKTKVSAVAAILFLAALYFVTARFGLSLAFIHASATLVWPPSGIALAALLLFGLRLWPGIFLGAFTVNFFNNLSLPHAGLEVSILIALGIAAGNTLEAIAGNYLLQRFANGSRCMERTSDLFKYVLFGVLIGPVFSASFGVSSLSLGGLAPWHIFGSIWLTWWLGDSTGILIFTSFLLIWRQKPSLQWTWFRRLEAVAVILASFFVSQIIFAGWIPMSTLNYPIAFVYIPILFWSAFRFGAHGVSVSSLIISMMAILGTLKGFGPFSVNDPNVSLMLMQSFLGVVTVSVLSLASVLKERQQLHESLLKFSEERTAELTKINAELLMEITRRKRIEEVLAQQAQHLVRSNAELQQFAYIASHDLQEPLRMVASYAQLIGKRYREQLDSNGQQFIAYMIDGATRMQRLIRDLLDYSRLESQDKPFVLVECSSVMETVMKNLQWILREKNASVTWDPLPQVAGDFTQLVELFQNLIGNGVKFNEQSKPAVHVSVQDKGKEFIFSVRDNGIGIAPEYKENIFVIFQRLHGYGKFDGTGIGLTICRKIVQRHGGRIWVESNLNQGSTFFFSFPK